MGGMGMDLVSWLVAQGAKVRKGGQEYCINCPNCGDVKRHMYVNLAKGVAHCFKCGFSGRVEEVLVSGFRLKWDEVRELVGSSVFEKKFRESSNNVVEVKFPDASVDLESVGVGVRRLVELWCKDNGVHFSDLVEMRCRWWEGRLVIPCWRDRERKELWYWVARAVSDKVEPRYINCVGSRSGVLWGLDWYDVSDGYLYVCEGWKDAYKVRGVAILGKSVADGQVEVIRSIVKGGKVRVVLDSDAWNDCLVVGKGVGEVLGMDRVEVGFLAGLKDPGEGREKDEVLRHTRFVSLGSGLWDAFYEMKRVENERRVKIFGGG
jgi:predicted RNA-binding Zn-ribbon protein involved in translation (DUF1610 family)